jgi:hypothetical protein
MYALEVSYLEALKRSFSNKLLLNTKFHAEMILDNILLNEKKIAYTSQRSNIEKILYSIIANIGTVKSKKKFTKLLG